MAGNSYPSPLPPRTRARVTASCVLRDLVAPASVRIWGTCAAATSPKALRVGADELRPELVDLLGRGELLAQLLQDSLRVGLREGLGVLLHVVQRVLVRLDHAEGPAAGNDNSSDTEVGGAVLVAAGPGLVHGGALEELPADHPRVALGGLKDLQAAVHEEEGHDKVALRIGGRVQPVRGRQVGETRGEAHDLALVGDEMVHVTQGLLGHEGHAVCDGVLVAADGERVPRGDLGPSARDAFAVGTGSAAKSATERPRMLLRYQFCVNSSQS